MLGVSRDIWLIKATKIDQNIKCMGILCHFKINLFSVCQVDVLKFLDEQSEINILKVHITNNWSGK